MVTRKRTRLHNHGRGLRDRFARAGATALSDDEMVELLLSFAIRRSDAGSLARQLIAQFQSLRGVLDARSEELQEIPGIGGITPTLLRVIRATATLYLEQRAEGQDALAEPEKLAAAWRMRIGALPNEVFEVGFLDSGYRLLRNGVQTLVEGTIDRATVYPRRIVEAALRRGAFAIVLAHNHPNGTTAPSEHDKYLTRAIVLAAETVGIRVLDHLIVTADDAFSFRRAGLL